MSALLNLPSWVEMLPRAPRVALLLVGGFQIGHAPDAAVLQQLGSSAKDVQFFAERLQAASSEEPSLDPDNKDAALQVVRLRGRLGQYDSVVYVGGEELAWRDHALAWGRLAMDLTATDLDRLQAVILDVLLRARQQPPWPNAEGAPPSPRMLNGLAESLALLGNNDDLRDATVLSNRLPSSWADAIVQQLLSTDPHRWSLLHPWLSMLAEAAPRPFLSTLLLSIEGPTDSSNVPAQVGALRRQLAESHELLHALQILGWDANLMPQVAQCLGYLLSADPNPYRAVSPRPLSVLIELLGYALPQTTASAEQRLDVLRIMAQDPLLRDSARLLLGALWSAGPIQMRSPAPRPRFLHIHIPDTPDSSGEALPYGQVETYVELLMQLAKRDARHWASLVSAAHVPDTLACKVLQRLRNLHEQIDDPDGLIWSELRGIRNWLARAREPAISRPAFQRRRKLSDEVYILLRPQDPVVRYAHLFAVRPELEDEPLNFADLGKRVAVRRTEALQELWNRKDRWELITRLANLVCVPGEPNKEIVPLWLAGALYLSPFGKPLIEKLLAAKDFSPFLTIAPPLLARHLVAVDPSFAEATILMHRLVHEQRTDEAWALAVEISRYPEGQGALWRVLDELGEPLVGRYWRQAEGVWMTERPRALQDLALERLLANNNLNEALHIAVNEQSSASPSHRLMVLEYVAEEVAKKAGTPRWQAKWGFDLNLVVEFLQRLSRVPDIDPERACAAELNLLDALSHTYRYEPIFVARKIARSPAWLAERLRDPSGKTTVLRLLHSWSGYPGDELLPSQQSEALERWCMELLSLLPEHRKDALGIIGSLLARPDPDTSDRLWPCRAARRFLDQLIIDQSQRQILMRAMQNERRQQRGMTSRAIGEGGEQERTLAQQYRHAAQRLHSRWMHTAELLDALAGDYEQEAKSRDADAAEDAWRYKMPTPANEEIPPQGAQLFPLTRVKLENFRSLASFDLPLDPHLNVLIGRNASGKTTVLDAIAAGLAKIHDEIFGSKLVDQFINSRIDRTVTWLPDGESRQADSLRLQFFGQHVSANRLAGDKSSDLATARTESAQIDALLWDILSSPTARRGARNSISTDEPLRNALSTAKEVLSGREQTPLPLPIFAYYGTKRSFGADVLEEEPKHLEDLPEGDWLLTRASAYDGALNPRGGYKLMVSWWRSRQTAEREKGDELNNKMYRLPELAAVRTAVEQAVRVASDGGMRCTNPRTKSGRPGLIVDFDRGDGSSKEELELSQMSDGFRTHLALVMDLARRMVQANPPPEGDINREGWGTRSRAVVLIDEVDLHLHPSWQRYVLAGLRAAFPNAQFIVTTHSPQAIASVDARHVFKLGTGLTPIHPAHTKGMDSNSILTAVMGDRYRDIEAQRELDALADLIDNEQFDKANAELQRLTQKYGDTDPELIRLGGLLRFLEPDSTSSEE